MLMQTPAFAGAPGTFEARWKPFDVTADVVMVIMREASTIEPAP
jgi:hypothetical protein